VPGAVPEGLEWLGREERRRTYGMLRLEVSARSDGTLERFANRAVPCKDIVHGDLLERPKDQSGGRCGAWYA
jgi:hypothetical protein